MELVVSALENTMPSNMKGDKKILKAVHSVLDRDYSKNCSLGTSQGDLKNFLMRGFPKYVIKHCIEELSYPQIFGLFQLELPYLH